MNEMQVFTNPAIELKGIYPKKPNDYLGYFYMLEYADGIKIGSTKNPTERFNALNRNALKYGSGVLVGRIAVSVEHTNYRENETMLHHFFSGFRVVGTELFNITLDSALSKLSLLCLEYRDDTCVFEKRATAFTEQTKNFVLGIAPKVFHNEKTGESVKIITSANGSIAINAFDVAVGLGWSQTKRGVVYVRWDTINSYCHSLGFSQQVGKDTFIPESVFYRLAMKANNETAEKFQSWIASEVLPAIRRTGAYTAPSATPTPQREFTTDDYIRAASIIAGCKNERLPYVLNLLTQGGFTVPTVERIRTDASKDTSGECARLINQAISDYGMGTREIGRLTGLAATQIQRIRTAQSIPTVARSNIIIAAIKNAVPEIE